MVDISSWSTTKKLKVAAASIATAVGIGLSVLLYKRVQQQEIKKSEKSKSKRKSAKVQTEGLKVSKEKLISIITSITTMMGHNMPQLAQMQKVLADNNVPEDQMCEAIETKFQELLKQIADHVYKGNNVTEADVMKSHKAYQNDPQVKKHSGKLRRLKRLLKPMPVPESVTLEQAKEVMVLVIKSQASAIIDTLDKVKKDLNIASNAELGAILSNPSDPRGRKIQDALSSVEVEPLLKKILAKHDNLGTDTQIFAAITAKFQSDESFKIVTEAASRESQASLQAVGLRMATPGMTGP